MRKGKTNLLESIYVLAMTRSHRTNSEQELIGWNDDQSIDSRRNPRKVHLKSL